jgi:hypothetical protein
MSYKKISHTHAHTFRDRTTDNSVIKPHKLVTK